MGQIKIGILYLGLHNQLVKAFGVNHIISRKQFFAKISRHFLFPKNLRPVLLKEMERMSLIERIDRDNVKILSCTINIDEDASELFKMVGLF